MAPSGARTGMKITPRSSIGDSSLLALLNRYQLPPAEASITITTSQRLDSDQRSAEV